MKNKEIYDLLSNEEIEHFTKIRLAAVLAVYLQQEAIAFAESCVPQYVDLTVKGPQNSLIDMGFNSAIRDFRANIKRLSE